MDSGSIKKCDDIDVQIGTGTHRVRPSAEPPVVNGYALDHVAIVVKDLEATLAVYVETLGFACVYREIVSDQGVEAVGLRAGDSIVELLRPLDEASAIARFRGEAPTKLHHTAYRVADIEGELARLRAKNVRLIDEVPRRGAHGNTIAFLHPKSTGGVLVELCQPPEKG